ncbi:hypothetical protein QBC40DRAFT_297030 [Triangularia verruculosa]|uniref:Uncharacterized protein n=1 Tax=Triangularia verruculosa TaxID=2587418 RepID=A0AAN6XIJ7_9PEZI|nr:hypothetical protein QBC40DRAFT_297030 [Triangularia verruculosa]
MAHCAPQFFVEEKGGYVSELEPRSQEGEMLLGRELGWSSPAKQSSSINVPHPGSNTLKMAVGGVASHSHRPPPTALTSAHRCAWNVFTRCLQASYCVTSAVCFHRRRVYAAGPRLRSTDENKQHQKASSLVGMQRAAEPARGAVIVNSSTQDRRKALEPVRSFDSSRPSSGLLLLQNGFPNPALPSSPKPPACTNIVVELQRQHSVGGQFCLGQPAIEPAYQQLRNRSNIRGKADNSGCAWPPNQNSGLADEVQKDGH